MGLAHLLYNFLLFSVTVLLIHTSTYATLVSVVRMDLSLYNTVTFFLHITQFFGFITKLQYRLV